MLIDRMTAAEATTTRTLVRPPNTSLVTAGTCMTVLLHWGRQRWSASANGYLVRRSFAALNTIALFSSFGEHCSALP